MAPPAATLTSLRPVPPPHSSLGPGPAHRASPRPLVEEPGDLGGPEAQRGAGVRSPSSPESPRTPSRRQTLPPPARPRPFPAAGTGSARPVPARPQPPQGPGGPAPEPRLPTSGTGEEAAPRARAEKRVPSLGGKARCRFSSPRGPPASLWSGEGAGPHRGARTGWGGPCLGSASRPSSASSPSPDSPLGRGGWVGGDSGRVAESQSLQPGCGADGRGRYPREGRYQGRRSRRWREKDALGRRPLEALTPRAKGLTSSSTSAA